MCFSSCFAQKMAYLNRGRGYRWRGSYSRGNFSDNMNIRYTRRDSNRFSCLMGQDGGDEGDEQQLAMLTP